MSVNCVFSEHILYAWLERAQYWFVQSDAWTEYSNHEPGERVAFYGTAASFVFRRNALINIQAFTPSRFRAQLGFSLRVVGSPGNIRCRFRSLQDDKTALKFATRFDTGADIFFLNTKSNRVTLVLLLSGMPKVMRQLEVARWKAISWASTWPEGYWGKVLPREHFHLPEQRQRNGILEWGSTVLMFAISTKFWWALSFLIWLEATRLWHRWWRPLL